MVLSSLYKRIFQCALLLLFPVVIWGQVAVKSSVSYDISSDMAVDGLHAVILLEHMETISSLAYSFSDSIDYEWFMIKPEALPVAMSAKNRDTIAQVDISDEAVYQLKTIDTSYYFAVLDFSDYQSALDSVWVDDAGDSCQTLRLHAELEPYKSISVYSPLRDSNYVLVEPTTLFKWENVNDAASIPLEQSAPYQDTLYTCTPYSADFFSANDYAVKYYKATSLTTSLYEAKAVKVGDLEATIADEGDLVNKIKRSSKTEGSAPLDVTYSISPSPSIDYSNWWIWNQDNEQPNAPIYRFEEQITHSFVKYVPNGYRIKVEVGNEYCLATDSTEVMVYESALEAPNVMVLSGAYGKYKVAYQSIDPESFRATIYDRWGRRIYQWTDPNGGWDGRSPVTQAYVSPGVYYCAVKARGTDGKKHDDLFEITAIKGK